MPIRLIGKKSHFTGNLLFEILNNLKNYGVGRVVCLNSYKKFPEICYYVVRKVIPMRETIGPGPDELVYGKVWVEEVFRGKKMEGLKLIDGHTCMPDWYLIPKEEEAKYLNCELKEVVKTLPKYDSVPPVIGELMKRKYPTLNEPKMERVYPRLAPHLSYRIAEDGMTPDHKLKVQIPDDFKIGVRNQSNFLKLDEKFSKLDASKQSSQNYSIQRDFHSLVLPNSTSRVLTNYNMLQSSRLASSLPLMNGAVQKVKQKLRAMMGDSTKIAIAACLVYEKCADTIAWDAFLKYFKLNDTFHSWFLAIELHVWMLSLVAISEKNGRVFRNRLVEEMWNDVEQRLDHLAEMKSTTKKEYLTTLNEQFQAALVAYDEGILDDDKALAAAIWRTIYAFNEEIDPKSLEALVLYIRKQIEHLDTLNSEEMMFHGNVSFLSLTDIVLSESLET